MLLADEVAVIIRCLSDNPYQPYLARIVRIEKMVENTQVFTLRFLDEHLVRSFRHQPGQFVMLSIPGTGEMPISISSSPTRPEVLELCVRRVGRVTNALYRMRTNDVVGVRGPYGNGYPMQEIAGHDLLLAAGGLGMAPLRSLLWYALDHRDQFNNLTLMYGSKRPEDMLFREELSALVDRADINCLLTVDADPSGHVEEPRRPAAHHVRLRQDRSGAHLRRGLRAAGGLQVHPQAAAGPRLPQEPDSHVARAAHEMRSRQMRALQHRL
jgi:NAD(P)H-flavin reductase